MLYSREGHRKLLLKFLYDEWNASRRGVDLMAVGGIILEDEEILNAIGYLSSHGLIKPWIDQGEVYILTERGVIVADKADRNLHADLDSLIDPMPSVSYHNHVQGNSGPVMLQQAGHGAVQHQTYTADASPVELKALIADLRAALTAPGSDPNEVALVEQHLQLVEAHAEKGGSSATVVASMLQSVKTVLECAVAIPGAAIGAQKVATWLGTNMP